MADEYAESPWDFVADHVRRYEATDGQDGLEFEGAEAVILTTRGRKTAKIRKTPLIRIPDGDNYLVVASQGGAPQHPAWYLNLSANSEVEVQVVAEKFRARARTATGDERAKIWEQMVEVYSPYTEYQARTEREIPVVVLEPITV